MRCDLVQKLQEDKGDLERSKSALEHQASDLLWDLLHNILVAFCVHLVDLITCLIYAKVILFIKIFLF